MARHGESKHFKRSVVTGAVSIPRKRYKYYVRNLPGKHENQYAIALLGVIRDVGKFALNAKEARYLINNGFVKVDGKTVREERYNLGFGDILTVKEDSFILWFGPSGKFILKPYDTPEVKLMKVVSIYSGKKGKKILFTNDGRNIIYDGSIKAGDSIKYNLKEKKVVEIIPFEQGREAVIYRGKNLGKSGKIEEIVGDNSLLSINGEKLTALSDACMVL